MSRDKYSAIQKRLGALDLNDDILRDEYNILLKNFNELLEKHRDQGKAMDVLKVKNSTLIRENKELSKSLRDTTSRERKDLKNLARKDIMDMFSGGKGFKRSAKDIIGVLGQKNKLLDRDKMLKMSKLSYGDFFNDRNRK